MDKANLQDKFRAAILGGAIGDALGYPIEFANTPETIQAIVGPDGVVDLPAPALFSDDTQLSICVANALLKSSSDSDSFIQAFANELVDWKKTQSDPAQTRNPDDTTLAAAERLIQGSNYITAGINGFGNGSAVRTAPIGLRYNNDITTIIDIALSSSRVTHQDSESECGAVANALITCCAALDVPVGVWGNEVLVPISGINASFEASIQKATELSTSNLPPYLLMSDKYLGQGWGASDLIACSLYCCMTNPNNFKSAVLTAANSEGDSDGIACVVGGWMGAKLGTKSIPKEWIERIEKKEELIKIADSLYEASIH